MGKIGSFGASLSLHAGALALFLTGPVPEAPRASVAAPTPSPLSFDIRLEPDAPSFEREPSDVLPLAEAPDLELEVETRERRVERVDSPPRFDRPMNTAARAPAPEVEAEESPVEIRNPPPAYPASARRRRLEGHAIVEVKIRKDGSVAEPKVVDCSGSPLFAEAALDAVRAWRYAPLRAERAHRVRFEFKLRA